MSTRYDELNTLFEAFADALEAYEFGVRAQVPLPDNKGWLGYGKINKIWQLFYQSPNGVSEPLTRTTTLVRISAAHELLSLFEALKQTAQERDGILDEAIAITHAAIAKVRNK